MEKVKKLAEGKIYTGTQAKDLGLIDAIGNFYDTVDALKELQDQGEARTGLRGKALYVLEMGLRLHSEGAYERDIFVAL